MTAAPVDLEGGFVVVGGGIGGLSAALGLARGGHQVTVLESAPQFGEIGAGLQLAPNATRILRRWGLLDAVMDAGVRPRRLVLSDAMTGRELTSMELGRAFLERYGAPYVVLHRKDLHDVVLDACRAEGVALVNDGHAVAVREDAGGAEVDCLDGRSFRAAAVVVADGLNSTLRTFFVDDEPIPCGYVAYRGALPIEAVDSHADLRDVQVYVGTGMHLVQYALRGGRMYNQVAVFRSERFFGGQADWGTPEELQDRFGAACSSVRQALPSLWLDQRWPMYDREPIDRWATGRIALLGDAAHPMLQYLAQGACQAFEDADCLGRAVADHVVGNVAAGGLPAGELARALDEYQRTRVPRASRVQRNARTWGEIWHTDGVAVLLRNELFARRSPTDYQEADWLYGDTPAVAVRGSRDRSGRGAT
ncbi:MAG TPA: FAD-dependent monooxygenase [Acidimicrobiales bacterium]|nr:FAD-dependent monooxygenase [Acidimicrobiales bacterium]